MGINEELAAIFYDIADIHELIGEGLPWKPIAYRKAARAVEGLAEEVDKAYARGGLKALLAIPGVGQSIAEKIEEFIKTGKMRHYDELRAKLPPGLTELMQLEGLGPKKAMLLHKKLRIKSVAQLEAAAKAGKLRKLEGFGEKTEKNILESIEMKRGSAARTPIWEAMPLARKIVAAVRGVPGVDQAEVAGSTRRMKETVGDLDILVTAKRAEPVMDFFTKMPDVARVLSKGPTKSTVVLRNGMQSDLRVLEPKAYGAALQYFTGSVDHNVAVRSIAVKKGYKLSEYGLFNRKTGKYVAGRTEEEVYKKLGLDWAPPEIRENRGEVEAAARRKLPKLVELRDIRGDFHVHTTWSDGLYSMDEMVAAAKARGYEYVAISDHSQSERQARGMKPDRFAKYLKEIERVRNAHSDITVLASSEVDILPDGKMDYPEKLLDQLDVVIGSVHSGFKMPKEKMTERIVTAVESGLVDIVAHPTGRIVGSRKPYDVDLDKVFEAAASHGVAMEVNSLMRLDLKDEHVRGALGKGCDIAIDTDSHDKAHLQSMAIGVGIARRGWAEKKDVVNTLPLARLRKRFKRIKA
jgi:DNA polymerase (family 10)